MNRVHVHTQFPSAIIHITVIYRHIISTCRWRQRFLNHLVLSHFLVYFQCTGQPRLEERKINTQIIRFGLFPFQIIIRQLIQRRFIFFRYIIHGPHLHNQIGSLIRVYIPLYTIRHTNCKLIHPFHRLHKYFIVQIPLGRSRPNR